MAEETREKTNFIWEAIKADIAEGKNGGRVQTRFPPEPNGYLHIGHVKALSVDFLTAERFGGVCNLRFDDTNPTKEKEEFVEAIKDDIHWLGFNYANVYYASEQYDQIYEFALDLIRRGLAYVDDLSKEEIREYRGTLTQPGKNSPYRDRTPEENMDLFLRMKNGEFPEGSRVLRAKIDMASPNINMRDPTIYRVLHKRHMRELRRAKLERQRRMAEAAAQEPARSAPERPRETVHAAAPSRPRPQQPSQQRPQQPSQQQRPAQDAVQPAEAKRLAQEKARRDYFEEFFKNKQD